MTVEEKSIFETAARLSGLSLAAWVRMILRVAAEWQIRQSKGESPWSNSQ